MLRESLPPKDNERVSQGTQTAGAGWSGAGRLRSLGYPFIVFGRQRLPKHPGPVWSSDPGDPRLTWSAVQPVGRGSAAGAKAVHLATDLGLGRHVPAVDVPGVRGHSDAPAKDW